MKLSYDLRTWYTRLRESNGDDSGLFGSPGDTNKAEPPGDETDQGY